MTTTKEQTDDLVRSQFAMLRDLELGYPWRELGIDLQTLRERAEELGIDISEVFEE